MHFANFSFCLVVVFVSFIFLMFIIPLLYVWRVDVVYVMRLVSGVIFFLTIYVFFIFYTAITGSIFDMEDAAVGGTVSLVFLYSRDSLLLYIFTYSSDSAFSLFELCTLEFVGQDFLSYSYFMHLSFSLDLFSLLMFSLVSINLLIICYLGRDLVFMEDLYVYYFLLSMVSFGLYGAFSVLDFFGFYAFFEFITIPLYYMIGMWGSRSRKIYAGYKFLIYTLVGSVALLIPVLLLGLLFGTTDLYFVKQVISSFTVTSNDFLFSALDGPFQILMVALLFFGFFVKIPIVPLHKWLTEAHVEAPLFGSMLLAGVVLKLGVCGLVRFLFPLFPVGVEFWMPFVLLFAVYSCYVTVYELMFQSDIKRFVAYSSVTHMSLVVFGICVSDIDSLYGSMLLMYTHGFVSSGLFYLIGLLYSRMGTRLHQYYNGLVSRAPYLSLWLFLFSLANIGLPCFPGFIAEFSIYSAGVPLYFGVILLLLFMHFQGACAYFLGTFRLLFGGIASYGSVTYLEYLIKDISIFEFLTLCCLFLFILSFGMIGAVNKIIYLVALSSGVGMH